MSTPGERLVKIRAMLRMSSYQMAYCLNITQSYLSRCERDKREIKIGMLIILHEKFRILPNYITVNIEPVIEPGTNLAALISAHKRELVEFRTSVRLTKKLAKHAKIELEKADKKQTDL